jgi:hypothetical protein
MWPICTALEPAWLPLATVLVLSVSGCTNSHRPAPTPMPSQKSASQVVVVVDYGIGAGDKRVMPTAFRRVTGGSCLAWQDLMSRGAGIYELHLRIPSAHVAIAKRSAQMLVKHALIAVAPDTTFADPPTNMEDPSQISC